MFGLIKKWFSGNNGHSGISQDATVVDVRSPQEFESGHVQGALNIPLEQLPGRLQELQGVNQVVLYCRSGNRSAHARRILIDAGIRNVTDGGGLNEVVDLLRESGVVLNLVKNHVAVSKESENSTRDTQTIKVLIPTDFSQQADFARIMAEKLSEKLTLETHYINILEVPETVTLDDTGEILSCGEIDPEYLRAEKQKAIDSLEKLKQGPGNKIFTHFAMGKLTETLIRFANVHKFDLIIMGTKGSWGLKERFSGSESQHVARKSEIPLLTLMCDRSDLVIQDVLVVHDYHEEDYIEIPLLNKFKEFFKVKVHQLYIDVGGKVNQDEALKAMAKYAHKHQMEDCDNHIISAPDVEKGVLQFLQKRDVDMIFIGTHGKGGIFHASAAEKLVNHLFKPIITYHIH